MNKWRRITDGQQTLNSRMVRNPKGDIKRIVFNATVQAHWSYCWSSWLCAEHARCNRGQETMDRKEKGDCSRHRTGIFTGRPGYPGVDGALNWQLNKRVIRCRSLYAGRDGVQWGCFMRTSGIAAPTAAKVLVQRAKLQQPPSDGRGQSTMACSKALDPWGSAITKVRGS